MTTSSVNCERVICNGEMILMRMKITLALAIVIVNWQEAKVSLRETTYA